MTSTELDTKKQVVTTAVSKRTLVSVPMTVTQSAPPKKTSRIRRSPPRPQLRLLRESDLRLNRQYEAKLQASL